MVSCAAVVVAALRLIRALCVIIVVLFGHSLRNRMIMVARDAVYRQVTGVVRERRQWLQFGEICVAADVV